MQKNAREVNDKAVVKFIGKSRAARSTNHHDNQPCSTTFRLLMIKRVLHVRKTRAAKSAFLFTIKLKRDGDASKPRSDWLSVLHALATRTLTPNKKKKANKTKQNKNVKSPNSRFYRQREQRVISSRFLFFFLFAKKLRSKWVFPALAAI